MNLPWPLRLLLWPLSVAYGSVARARAWLYARGWLRQKRLRGTVISVGNLTVGGTGKTPMVLWLAERFLAEGKRVAILSRGYRGSGDSSDEVDLLRARLGNRVPVGVSPDRHRQGTALAGQGYNLFLLDDGFQHLQLARDLDIVMIDGSSPLEAERLLPAGHLREPVSSLRRADLIVISRRAHLPKMERSIRKYSEASIFGAATKLVRFYQMTSARALSPDPEITGKPAFAFCGIGNPHAFFQDLQQWGVSIAGHATFPDHHPYRTQDLRRLEDAARQSGAMLLVTTEKDAQNLSDLRFATLPLYVCEMSVELDREAEFLAAVGELSRRRSGAGT